ncbi:hypothetical protein ACE7GA_20805 [Roseomonas sp. CCTCC AB2023176]|uniref:hypothetical protein n=1 Tax=Roseomonas sp. CCTCC AB2023176 TaxID=3342640 RepID=UPI0035E0A4FE
MAQDSDVARMAAALRTPSLRYRSFGNEPVRNPGPRIPTPPADDFPLLGEALAAIESLPPDATIVPGADGDATLSAGARSPAPEPPAMPVVMAPEAPAAAAPEAVALPPSLPAAPVVPTAAPTPVMAPATPLPRPSAAAPPVVAAPPRAPMSTPVVPRAVAGATPAGGTPSLLQTLLAEAPPRPVAPQAAPIVVGRHPPQAPVPPPRMAAGAAEPILPSAPAAGPRGTAPPVPPLPGPRDALGWTGGRRQGPGSGSSLLDTLVGRGEPSQSAVHYPLLDALTAAMRSDLSGASSRVWPAARVEMALPELLRRVAAGVRTGRGVV